jgi:hypothetical protein
MKLLQLLMLALVLPAFANAAPRLSQALIGRWHYADDEKSCTYTFRADGTFAGTVSEKSKVIWRFSGRWSVSRDLIHYEYTDSSLKQTPPGTTDQDKVLEITPDHLIITAFDGSRRRYERVRDGG